MQNVDLVGEDKIDKALEIISETCWDGDMEAVKLQRLELYEMACLDADQLRKASGVVAKGSKTKQTDADENASYSSLVGSTGF